MRRRALAVAVAAAALAATGCGGKQKKLEPAPQPDRKEAPDTPEEKGVPPEGDRPRVPASPEALLAPGAVREIQRALVTRGYLERLPEAGELDDTTSAGIRKFQEDEGLAATGMPDRETLDRLGVSAAKAYGREETESAAGDPR